MSRSSSGYLSSVLRLLPPPVHAGLPVCQSAPPLTQGRCSTTTSFPDVSYSGLVECLTPAKRGCGSQPWSSGHGPSGCSTSSSSSGYSAGGLHCPWLRPSNSTACVNHPSDYQRKSQMSPCSPVFCVRTSQTSSIRDRSYGAGRRRADWIREEGYMVGGTKAPARTEITIIPIR